MNHSLVIINFNIKLKIISVDLAVLLLLMRYAWAWSIFCFSKLQTNIKTNCSKKKINGLETTLI